MSEELQTPNLDLIETPVEIQEVSPEDVDAPVVTLPLGKELTSQETYSISAREPSIFVVLAGITGCGKTTLVTSLYQEFFQKIPQCYYFAGSQTLKAFEQRAYLTRISSKQKDPQMQRTASGSLDSILHLRVWDSSINVHKNLLLTDFSGEDYDNVCADIISAKEDFNMVSKAKYIIMLLDGGNIANNKLKHKEIQKAVHILRTFSDANLLYPKICIIVAISKYDLVYEQYEKNPELKQFVEDIPEKIGRQIPKIMSRIIFTKIAAMPDNPKDIDIGFGIADLMHLLLTPYENKNDAIVQFSTSDSISEFNLFQERVLK